MFSIGFNKFILGIFDPSINGFPANPSVNDNYISAKTYNNTHIYWTKNYIYTWDGTTWIETIPVTGNSEYITGSGNGYENYREKLVYYDGSNWTIYNPQIYMVYDGNYWRKTVKEFYDPTNNLPTVTIPNSIGETYISSETVNNWKQNYIYVYDGWQWNEIEPTQNYGLYVENGETYSECIVIFTGLIWEVLSLSLPMYNFANFKKKIILIAFLSLIISCTSQKSIDWNYLIYVFILLAFGLAMLASAGAPLGYVKFNDSYFYLKRQLLYGVLPGALLFLLVLKVNSDLIRKLAWIFYFACIFKC